MILLSTFGFGLELIIGNRTIKFLKDSARLISINPPKVSVIIAARNEEREIASALQSVLNQDYDNLEVIVVNDRSTDATRQILTQIATQHPQLKIIHLHELPSGWLGKNHALHIGSYQATGKLILFTDADVVMKPEAISKAVNYLLEHRLDHLTCLPQQSTPSLPLRVFIATFSFYFALYARPWRARRPNRWHIGIGAFQLIRNDFYRRMGGHALIAMRPDDDLKLGKLVKKNGGRQEMIWGEGVMSVAWYHSIKELVHGLMKNSFASVEYSLLLLVASTLAMAFFNLFPFVAVFITSGNTRWINLAAVILLIIVFCDNARFVGLPPWHILGYPFATLLFMYILWKAALTTILRGGIYWRDTKYSLKELRQNKV
ncbi:MAG: glycosyltransferase [Acidobacteria bacterium]|nr:glycosyltransferase [Acidobacteriota bacterium]